MIEKKRRITRKTFMYDPKQRISLFGKFLTMTQYSDKTTGVIRFSVTVSKKISKKATERNHLKRVVYEAVKQKAGLFDQKFNGSIVFSLKKSPGTPLYNEILTDLESFLHLR